MYQIETREGKINVGRWEEGKGVRMGSLGMKKKGGGNWRMSCKRTVSGSK